MDNQKEEVENNSEEILNADLSSGKNNGKKTFRVFVGIFFVIVLLVVGGVLLVKHQQGKIAKDYLMIESEKLSEIVGLVNDLSTEEIIDRADNDENSDFSKKILGEEIEKTKEVLSEIKLAKEENEVRKSNKHTIEINSILVSFYDDLEGRLEEYKVFVEYNLRLEEIAEEEVKKSDEMREKYQEFIRPGSREYDKWIEEAKDKIKILERSKKSLAESNPPKGLIEYGEKLVEVYDGQIEIIEKVPGLLKEKKYQEYSAVSDELKNFYAVDYARIIREAVDIYEYYFDNFHEDISSLEKKVDRLRDRMSTKAAELDIEVEDVEIERW